MDITTSPALRPYRGTFGPAEARHLVRRATIAGATQANVEAAVEMGLAASLNRLLTPHDPTVPVTLIEDHPTLNLGDPWLDVPRRQGTVDGWRDRSVREWMIAGLLESDFSLSGRMWFFWINHFGAVTNNPGRVCHDYLAKLNQHSLGNFQQLVKDITIDGQMLRFLNGRDNKAKAPNENYARELLELFTVGKGPQRAPGDYTYYTEDDVRAFARALTGWTNQNAGFPDAERVPKTVFFPDRHDAGDKQLSAAFGNAIITDAGDQEYSVVVETILEQPRSLDYLCRKLYRWFIDYRIDETVEAEVIRPLADLMRATRFDIGATIRTLLLSDHFFAAAHRGALPKSPLDHIAEVYIGYGGGLPARGDVKRRSTGINEIHRKLRDQGLRLDEPDSVAGYVAFHQEPNFNRLWIDPTNLLNRSAIVDQARRQGLNLGQGARLKPDLLAYVDTFANPYDPNDLVAEFAERHLPMPMPYDQVTTLKEYLIPDLPDWEWTVEYGLYRSNPDDEGQREAVAERVGHVWAALCGSAEYLLY